MEQEGIPNYLREFASNELARLKAVLPSRAEEKFIVFLEVQRVLDTWGIQHSFRQKDEAPNYRLDVLRWGMNLATSHLLESQTTSLRVPMARRSTELRAMATEILWNFGAIALTRRAADMIQHGFLLASRDGEVLSLRDSGTGPVQFMDHTEFEVLRKTEAEWTKDQVSPQGWKIVERNDVHNNLHVGGAFMTRAETRPSPLYTPDELAKLMTPLIEPWKVPWGAMIGYSTTPEVDEHFAREASYLMKDLRDAAGIHPDSRFGEFSGIDLLQVATLILSMFLKHVAFGSLAPRHFPDISFAESFTTWKSKDELVQSICELTGHSRSKVSAIMSAFTVTLEDLPRLAKESTPLLPMFIDLGNGLLLRPISSLLRNPLSAFQTISQWRHSSTRNAISASREAWFRSDLYGVFGGNRYSCVPGNIVLRKSGKRLTDIDAAVFDKTNGELALFQLKWQDYSTNDIRELRSKTSNLASEVDNWAASVLEWIKENSPEDVAQALRLRLKGPQRITSLFLFAVSRNISRTHGYGFPVTSPYLTITSWPQFLRIRTQIGPSPRVISKMHEVHRAEEEFVSANVTPHPVSIDLPGLRLRFENFWFTIGDRETPGVNEPRSDPESHS